jgi:hypothetical protein
MPMFALDNLDCENNQVYFSSEMSSFRTEYSVYEYDDVMLDGELETPITLIDVIVRNQCHVFIETDGTEGGDIVLDCRLTDFMCREVAKLIEKELLKCKQ